MEVALFGPDLLTIAVLLFVFPLFSTSELLSLYHFILDRYKGCMQPRSGTMTIDIEKTTPPFLKTLEEYRQLVDSADTFLFDCDGVLFLGTQLTENVKVLLDMLRSNGQ